MHSAISSFWNLIQRRLDATPMYRTVSLALLFLVVIALFYGFSGLLPYTGLEQVVSLTVAVAVAFLSNYVCSRLWKVSVNYESAFITALILFFLIIPAQLSDLGSSWVIALVTLLAIVSKFVFAWHKQHLVNPAAVGVVILALVYSNPFVTIPGYFESSWWIGRIEFFVPLLIAGAAVVAKVRKWTPVLAFLSMAFIVFLFEEWRYGADVMSRATSFWLAGPSLFLAFFMLTEPFTMPPTKKLQAVYGLVVGFISQTTIFLPWLKMTPEFALVIGNLIFYPTRLRQKLTLSLLSMKEVAKNTFEFVFSKPGNLSFQAGQYLEWMLPHSGADNRGIRRYFTIASAPSDSTLKLAVRFSDPSSSYKKELQNLQIGDEIIASQLAGDFVLPKDESVKVAQVAGGIGITPFLSQLGEAISNQSRRDLIMFYCNNYQEEIAYSEYLDQLGRELNFRVVNVLAKEEMEGYEFGYLTAEIIKRQTPDYLDRVWYLSGPPGMVNAYYKLLRSLGVKRRQIKRDFFSGL